MDGHGVGLSEPEFEIEQARAPQLARVPSSVGRRAWRALVVLVPIGFLALFFAYPVGTIIARGLRPNGRWQLAPLRSVFTDGSLQHVAWFTLWQATVSTLLTVVAGVPGAYVLSRYRFRGRRLVWAAVTIPFVLPTVVVGSAFLSLFGPRGPFGSLGLTGTVWPILLAHVFFNYAVVVRTVGGLWSHLDPRAEESARVLGANRWRAFREVTLPALRPAIAAAASIVFLFTFCSFGVVLILGGPHYSTLEVEIYRQTAELLNLPVAAALSIVQLVAVVAVLVVAGHLQQRRTTALRLRAERETATPVSTPGARLTLGLNLLVMAALLGVPIAVLIERSFATGNGYGFGFYRALANPPGDSTLFVSPLEAVRNSLVFAVIATVIALVVGGCAAFTIARRSARPTGSRALDTLIMLPLGTSAVTIGFGFLITLDHPPIDLRTSPVLIPIAHALVAAPFVVRVMVPMLRSIDPRLREAAAVLGAPPSRVWREIDLAIVARALLVAAGFAFAVSLGEFGATIFIVRPDYPTLPVVIYRLLSRPGVLNFGQAMAASVILMVVTGAAVLLIERFRAGSAGEF
ncbi:MAG TPA: iron ABC transporter permease [Acidimicrobiia bacterium]|nr:iron ABC transporter permease [Acidimicrobiia bacterium]